MSGPAPDRIVILAREEGYAGMDRPPLGARDDVPEALVVRGLALEAAGDLPALREFVRELRYEVIGLGGFEAPQWECLGFDVGETTPAAWSAIRRRGAENLNASGLFSSREDADAFLRAYLAADDPDRGWTADGWTDAPAIYGVVAVHRLVDPTYLAFERHPGLDVAGANLVDATLQEAELPGANLDGVDAFGALANGLVLTRATLRGANFGKAALVEADFSDADATGASFDRADLHRARFDRAVLRDATFRDAYLAGASFEGADLTGADFTDAHVRGATFHRATGAEHVDRGYEDELPSA